MIYMMVIFIVNSIKLFWHVSITILWFTYLIFKWIVDFTIGFFKGVKEVN